MRWIPVVPWLVSATAALALSACGPGPVSIADASAESDGGEPAEADAAYPPCATNDADSVDACDEDDGFVCLRATSIAGAEVCAVSGCAAASDCAAPPEGTAAVTQCRDDLADGLGLCVLACAAQQCPLGMLCAEGMCLWPDPR
jgi:hypothetical protein